MIGRSAAAPSRPPHGGEAVVDERLFAVMAVNANRHVAVHLTRGLVPPDTR